MWCVRARTLRRTVVPARLPMDRRIGPCLRARDESVFHRVMPAILNVRGVVLRVSDVVLPIAALPDPALHPGHVARTQRPLRETSGKPRLDQPPARREIAIPLGQGPDAVHVVRQNHPGVDREGALAPRGNDGPAQAVDLTHQKIRPTLGQCHGKEDGRARRPRSDVIRHPPRGPATRLTLPSRRVRARTHLTKQTQKNAAPAGTASHLSGKTGRRLQSSSRFVALSRPSRPDSRS